jgi:hypothetical protein
MRRPIANRPHRLAARALVALLVLVAGCGQKAAESTSASAPVEEPAGEPAPPDGTAWSKWQGQWNPAEIIDCPALGRRETRATCAAAGYLTDAAAAFNVPSPMARGETYRIRLAIERDADQARAVAAVDALPGETRAFGTKSGRFMRATLSGRNFEVTPLSPEQQDLFASDLGIWEWDVKPTAGGAQTLSLRTFVEAPDSDGKLRPAATQIEDREIRVTVTLWDDVGDAMTASEGWMKRGENWLIALAALIAALGAVWLAVRRFGRREG